jgi:hypothetical protein
MEYRRFSTSPARNATVVGAGHSLHAFGVAPPAKTALKPLAIGAGRVAEDSYTVRGPGGVPAGEELCLAT